MAYTKVHTYLEDKMTRRIEACSSSQALNTEHDKTACQQ